MTAVFEEFWVFSNEGEPLVHFQKSKEDSYRFNYDLPELDEKLLSDLKRIIQERSKEKNPPKKPVKLKDFEFDIAQCLQNESIIFYKTQQTGNIKKNLKMCEIVSKIFEETYKFNQLKFIDDDLEIFDKFKKKLALHFKLSKL